MPALPRVAGGRWGLAAAVLALAAGCLAFAAVSPVNGSADEPLHVDYAYQLWQGQLPIFEDGLVFRPDGVPVPAVQWTAQHPPLFYALLAPVVGPLIDSGHPHAAVLAARALCALIAVLCLLALAWAAAQLPARRPWAWALATAAVAAPLVPFLRVGGSVYNDDIAVLFSVLALGLTVRLLRRGWSAGSLLVLAAVCGLGALSRATFVVTLLAVTAGLCMVGWRHAAGGLGRRIVVGSALGALPMASAVVVAGWFYRRNIELTGSWTGGHPDWARDNLGRMAVPLADVLGGATLWRIPLDLLEQSPDHLAAVGPVLLLGLPLAGLAGLAWRTMRTGLVRGGDALLTAALLAAQTIGTLALTASYIAGGGGTAGRYLLPALLPIAVALASGVLAAGPRWSAAVLLGYGVAAWLPFVLWILDQPSGVAGRTANDVPMAAVWVAIVAIGLGVLGQAVGLAQLQRAPAELPAVDPAAVDPAAVDPAAVDPAAVDPAAEARPLAEPTGDHTDRSGVPR